MEDGGEGVIENGVEISMDPDMSVLLATIVQDVIPTIAMAITMAIIVTPGIMTMDVITTVLMSAIVNIFMTTAFREPVPTLIWGDADNLIEKGLSFFSS